MRRTPRTVHSSGASDDAVPSRIAIAWASMNWVTSRNGAKGRRIWWGRGRTVRVEVPDGAPRPVQLDGEVTGETPFEARLLPGALSVLVGPAFKAHHG